MKTTVIPPLFTRLSGLVSSPTGLKAVVVKSPKLAQNGGFSRNNPEKKPAGVLLIYQKILYTFTR